MCVCSFVKLSWIEYVGSTSSWSTSNCLSVVAIRKQNSEDHGLFLVLLIERSQSLIYWWVVWLCRSGTPRSLCRLLSLSTALCLGDSRYSHKKAEKKGKKGQYPMWTLGLWLWHDLKSSSTSCNKFWALLGFMAEALKALEGKGSLAWSPFTCHDVKVRHTVTSDWWVLLRTFINLLQSA